MHYREITRSEVENNHWTVLLKNNNSVLTLKGNGCDVCNDCGKKAKNKRGFVFLLICGDEDIPNRKEGFNYYKCVGAVNGCPENSEKMIIGLQI